MSQKITVSGARADAYRSYRDLRKDIGRNHRLLSTYRATVLRSPGKIDAETVALVLHGHVAFDNGTRDVLGPVFNGEDGVAIPYDQLRPLLRANDSAKAIIAACEPACREALANALGFLFIAAHPKLVTVEELDEIPTEGGDADDSADAPDKPPAGYGG